MSSLAKLRLNLFAIIALCGYGAYIIQGLDHQNIVVFFDTYLNFEVRADKIIILAYILDSTLLLAAVNILFFSCFKIHIAPDGRFCYDPNNPYWKFMRSLYTSWWGEKISLCRSFWITVHCELVILLVIAVCYTAYDFIMWATGQTFSELLNVGKIFAIAGAFIALFSLTIFYLGKLTDRFPWMKYVWYCGAGAGLVGLFVVLPIFVMLDEGFLLRAAILTYLKWAGMIGGTGVAVFGLVWTAFRYIPALRNTWLGLTLLTLKSKACLTLYECPVPKTKTA